MPEAEQITKEDGRRVDWWEWREVFVAPSA
jgi:hypothetical protein